MPPADGGSLLPSGGPVRPGPASGRDGVLAEMTDDTPISYRAATRGTPVLTSTGTHIGTLEHVLEVPDLDLFDGIVITTAAGLRFVDADDVQQITRSEIRCRLDDAQAAQLPAPDGPPVYRVDALADSGQSLHDRLGRLFRRPRWIREDD
jgi:hypothetical protein